MIEAFVFSPCPTPSTIPTATATMFLSTPPNSVPMTSSVTNERKYAFRAVIATLLAVSSDVEATTAAVGCCFAISIARFGPETTAIPSGSRPSSSAMTWVIRCPVLRSSPFMRETMMASAGMRGPTTRSVSRSDCDGTER